MNFKLIFLFAAVLCFGQGHAWFGGSIFKKAQETFNDFKDTVTNKVNSGLKDVQDSITNAGSKLKDQVDAARKNAEDTLRNKYDQARNEINGAANKLQGEIASISNKLARMTPSNFSDEAISISNKINVVVKDVQSQVEDALQSATSLAESRINDWDAVVKQAAAKANELGVDIKDCSADQVQELGKSALDNALGCLDNKITEGTVLVNKFISIGERSQQLVKDINAAYELCSKMGTVDSVACGAKEMFPKFTEIIDLSSDAISTSSEVVKLVGTLKLSLSACMTTVAATETIKVPELTIDITKCIAAKIQEKSAAAA